MNNNFSLSFSQPRRVDSDTPKSRNTFAFNSVYFITNSLHFSLMTQHDALLLWEMGMTAAVATVRHALDAIHIQQQHRQHCIGLLHWTPAPSPSSVSLRLARLYTRAIAAPTVLALSPLTWNYACLKNRGPWPQPRYNRIRVILKRVITRVQYTV